MSLRGDTLDILQAVPHGAKKFIAVKGLFHDRINAQLGSILQHVVFEAGDENHARLVAGLANSFDQRDAV